SRPPSSATSPTRFARSRPSWAARSASASPGHAAQRVWPGGALMRVEPAASLVGHVVVPGDKSISHRAVLIGSVGEGETRVHGFGRSGDTQASVDAVRSLGVTVEDIADDELVVQGAGLR